MPQLPFTKPYKSTTELLNILKSNGLILPKNLNSTKKYINSIGYSRLRIYFESRRNKSIPGKPFINNIKFRDIINMYNTDEMIRLKCFEGVGKFEIHFRNFISEYLSERYGSHPYINTDIYQRYTKDGTKNHKTTENHKKAALKNYMNVYSHSKDQRGQHYREKYIEPLLPPIWILKEFISFGCQVEIFDHFSNKIKSDISSKFNVNSHLKFQSWLRSLVDLRNSCAHHDRLFNRIWVNSPKFYRIKENYSIPTRRKNNKLASILECLDHLNGTNYYHKVRRIIEKSTVIDLSEADF